MKKIGATGKKLIRTLGGGAIDSTVSIAQLSGLRFGVVVEVLPLLIRQGYVRKDERGYYVLTPKGVMMSKSLSDIRRIRFTRKSP